ncbi:MAG: EAL domain-containing protein [Desulfovibrio sp.]|jgi:EAL and modified HD-GYP domain-containing signal transduction protein|nr:EAL domain-containing protein [Desulfovibrio sp.]
MTQQIQSVIYEEIKKAQAVTDSGEEAESRDILDVAVARQPIFDSQGVIWGYEMLYRKLPNTEYADIASGAVATARVIAAGFEAARRGLRPGQKILINFPAEMIESQVIGLLPKDICILEVLEDVLPTPAVLNALKEIKAAGYAIALDDYVGQGQLDVFLPLADIVKLDVLHLDESLLAGIARRVAAHPCILLAEKVETNEMKQLSIRMGCKLFQGFFFSKPEMLRGKGLSSSQAERMQILGIVNQKPVNRLKLSEAILHIPLLTAKFLGFVNSSHFAFSGQVTNVLRALNLIGDVTATQWLCVNVLAALDSSPASFALSFIASQRAKFLELLGETLRQRAALPPEVTSQELFFSGLFSLLESACSMPLTAILKGIPINPDVMNALLGKQTPYSSWIALMNSYARGEWNEALEMGAAFGLTETDMSTAYSKAMRWSSQFFSA